MTETEQGPRQDPGEDFSKFFAEAYEGPPELAPLVTELRNRTEDGPRRGYRATIAHQLSDRTIGVGLFEGTDDPSRRLRGVALLPPVDVEAATASVLECIGQVMTIARVRVKAFDEVADDFVEAFDDAFRDFYGQSLPGLFSLVALPLIENATTADELGRCEVVPADFLAEVDALVPKQADPIVDLRNLPESERWWLVRRVLAIVAYRHVAATDAEPPLYQRTAELLGESLDQFRRLTNEARKLGLAVTYGGRGQALPTLTATSIELMRGLGLVDMIGDNPSPERMAELAARARDLGKLHRGPSEEGHMSVAALVRAVS